MSRHGLAPRKGPVHESGPDPDVGGLARPAARGSAPADTAGDHVPRTRAGSAWVGLGAATLIVVALVVFMLQNTGGVDIRFLWMTGRTSLGLVLLIAVLGSVLVTVALGTVRILQLRRLVNRRRG